MKSPWKIALLLYGALAQLALLSVMAHFLFPRAGASLARSVPVIVCTVLGSAAISELLLRVFRNLSHAKGVATREILTCGGLCGGLATAVTYEVLAFAFSIRVNLPIDHSEGPVSSLMMFGLTLVSVHTYSIFDFIPMAALGFASGVMATCLLLRVYPTKSTTANGSPLVSTSV
jgi:hypothetical protein